MPTNKQPEPLFVTLSEACRLLSVKRSHIYALIKRGILTTSTINKRNRLIPRCQLERLVIAADTAKQ